MFDGLSTIPTVLYQGTDAFFEHGSCETWMLFLAHSDAGTISKILTAGSDLIVMVRGQERPEDLVVFPWGGLGKSNSVPDPEGGSPLQRSSIMVFDSSTPRVLRASPSRVVSMASDEDHLYWCEATGDRFELWRWPHARTGTPSRFAVLGKQNEDTIWDPRISVNTTHVLWHNPDAQVILGIYKRSGEESAISSKTTHPTENLVANDYDLYMLTGESDSHVALGALHSPKGPIDHSRGLSAAAL
jgi:hypothetical protein